MSDIFARYRKALAGENSRALAGFCWVVLVCIAGCSTLGRNRTQGNAIAAREMTRLGQEAIVENRWREAETRFAHAIDLCPEDVTARRHYAQSLWQLGQRKEAIQHLGQAVQMSGGDPNWTVELGNMHLSESHLDLASAAAEQALQVDDRLAAAWVLRAKVLLRQGHDDQALNDLHRARSLGPVDPEVYSSMAAIYERQQRPHRVLATLQRLEEQVGISQLNADTLCRRGLALRVIGRLDEAVETLAVAQQRDPQNQGIIVQLAESQFAAGQFEIAHKTLAMAQGLGPLPQQARDLLANIEARYPSQPASVLR